MYQTDSGVHVLVGVVSYGRPTIGGGCASSKINVYGRVTEVINWILAIVRYKSHYANTCMPMETDLKARLVHY